MRIERLHPPGSRADLDSKVIQVMVAAQVKLDTGHLACSYLLFLLGLSHPVGNAAFHQF